VSNRLTYQLHGQQNQAHLLRLGVQEG